MAVIVHVYSQLRNYPVVKDDTQEEEGIEIYHETYAVPVASVYLGLRGFVKPGHVQRMEKSRIPNKRPDGHSVGSSWAYGNPRNGGKNDVWYSRAHQS